MSSSRRSLNLTATVVAATTTIVGLTIVYLIAVLPVPWFDFVFKHAVEILVAIFAIGFAWVTIRRVYIDRTRHDIVSVSPGTLASIFPTRILAATDGTKEARLALTTAADLAKSTDSELHLTYVFPTAVQRPFPNPVTARPREVLEHELEEAMLQAQQLLDQQVDRVKEEGVSVAEAHLVRGRPDREIVRLSEEIGAGLIIMGSRGLGGVRRTLMGSVTDSVVRHAHCPVLVVRE